MKALVVSDVVVPFIYSSSITRRFSDVDLVIGCGDLPYYYLEYIISTLDAPLYFVRGNHDKQVEYSRHGSRKYPWGGIDLHTRGITYRDLLLAGVEGSLLYNQGAFQYSQAQMWLHVFRLIPRLFYNRLRYGRYLDIFVSHAPPAGIHDRDDLTHQGIRAFRWLIDVFQPAFFLHGHVHLYRPDAIRKTRVGNTQVINGYGYVEFNLGN